MNSEAELPFREEFVDQYYNEEGIHTLMWLNKSLCLDFTIKSLRYFSVSTQRLLTSLEFSPAQKADRFMWELKGSRGMIFHLYFTFSTLKTVWTPSEENKSHSMLTHWSSREGSTEQIENGSWKFGIISRHRRRRILLFLGNLQSQLSFRMLPARSRFWALTGTLPDIILWTQSPNLAVEYYEYLSIDDDQTAQWWLDLLPTWYQLFSSHPR